MVIDAVRVAIYDGETKEASRLNSLCVELGALHGVQVIDLHPVFAGRFERERRKFEFEYDSHWNAYAHGIVASELCRHLQQHETGQILRSCDRVRFAAEVAVLSWL